MYITNLEELSELVAERVSKQAKIREAVDAWVLKKYGIADFGAISRAYLGTNGPGSRMVLCRQIPSVRIEDIACRITAELLGYPLLSLSFIEDTFSCDNHEKKSYLHLKWADFGKKKNVFMQGQRIVEGALLEYAGLPLAAIPTGPDIRGETVPEYHFALRAELFGSDNGLLDVSDLHRQYVRMAGSKPLQLYSSAGGSVTKRPISECDLEGAQFRPAADWYYPLYFSWFLDGSLVMLETYDNELAQVSQAKKAFERTVQEIFMATGFNPLVLKIPPLDDKTLALPKKVIENPEAIAGLLAYFSGQAGGDSVQFISRVGDAVLNWGTD